MDILALAKRLSGDGPRSSFGIEREVVAAELRQMADDVAAGRLHVLEAFRIDHTALDDFATSDVVLCVSRRRLPLAPA